MIQSKTIPAENEQNQTVANVQQDRRVHQRFGVASPAQLWHLTGFGKRQHKGVSVVDISRGGLRLKTEFPVIKGEWVALELPTELAPNMPHGKMFAQVLRSIENITPDGISYHVGLVFSHDWRGRLRHMAEHAFAWGSLSLIAAIILNVIVLKHANWYFFWYHPWLNLYALLVSSYIISRVVLACFYRPPKLKGYLPTVSVIVACKNEEASIYRTIAGIYDSYYPVERMQVIVVNDGSTDGTLAEMQRAQADNPTLEIIDFPKNLGKRHGMAAGARAANGEILIYVDSDSFVRRDALRQMVAAFEDPDVGGVSGHAYAENAHTNLLTKMQEVRYYVAFRIVKAAESIFSAVTCCSGCLAAYRRTYVMEILDDWLQQRFLGTEATFGDDRSMTNYILRRWRVLYNSEAVCTTIVPDSWRVFLKQQLRWKKSWIRESLIGLKFIWKRHPLAAFFFYFGVIFPLASPMIVAAALFIPLMGYGSFSVMYAYGTMIMAVLYGLIYAARFRSGTWVYGIFFTFFYMFVLVWQTYYALFTMRRNHWGTR